MTNKVSPLDFWKEKGHGSFVTCDSSRLLNLYTVDGLIFVGYQFSWFLWMFLSMKSSTQKKDFLYEL